MKCARAELGTRRTAYSNRLSSSDHVAAYPIVWIASATTIAPGSPCYTCAIGQPANILWRNDGGTFMATFAPVLSVPGNHAGAAWGDVDDDGDMDVLQAEYEAEKARNAQEGTNIRIGGIQVRGTSVGTGGIRGRAAAGIC